MKNVVVDLGNYNIKYYGDRKGSFSAKYSTKFNPNEEMYERIQIDGQTIFIGIGSLSLEFNKIKKKLSRTTFIWDKFSNKWVGY